MDRIIRVPYLDQTDAAPTGCESVTAVMLLKYLGVEDLEFNRPAGMLYDGENPYAKY